MANFYEEQREQGYYGIVRWTTEDIHTHRKEAELPPWTEEQAEEWLLGNEDTLQELMVTRGWDYIYDTMISMKEEN